MSTPGYTVAQLRDALAFARAHPEGTLRIAWAPLDQVQSLPWTRSRGKLWPGTFTGTEWHCWYQQCLDRKINRAQPASSGRKPAPCSTRGITTTG